MEKLLELDTSALFSDALEYQVASAISDAKVESTLATFRAWTSGDAEGGAIFSGYRKELLARSGVAESIAMAREMREQFSTLVVLGIGGSALGARTALSALDWTVPEKERRQVYILDNLDPIDFEKTWSRLDLSKTLFAVVTKSGGTIETIAQLSVVLDRLAALKIDASKHILAITDPKAGALRSWASTTAIPTLAVPTSVGGRFSVLTPVGIFPIAFAGVDAEAMVQGAESFFSGQVIAPETIARFAIRLGQLEAAGFSAHVLMPYATLLKDFGSWFVQLWGESLGKSRLPSSIDQSPVGPVPVAAVGATDQHSLLQLLVEGSNRLITGFISVETWPPFGSRQPMMCRLPPEFASLSYAHGKSFSEILDAERKATQKVLADRAKPLYHLQIKAPLAANLGALFAFYMDLVAMTAASVDVNPFDQPGVEFGKKILPGLLEAVK